MAEVCHHNMRIYQKSIKFFDLITSIFCVLRPHLFHHEYQSTSWGDLHTQEAHGSRRSPEKPIQIKKIAQSNNYIITLIVRGKTHYLPFDN